MAYLALNSYVVLRPRPHLAQHAASEQVVEVSWSGVRGAFGPCGMDEFALETVKQAVDEQRFPSVPRRTGPAAPPPVTRQREW